MEYPFVYMPLGCTVPHCSIHCTAGGDRNGASVYNCMCEMVEYCVTEDATPSFGVPLN